MRRTPPAGNDRVTHSVLLARALEAPARAAILELLAAEEGRALSPDELANELRISVGKVSYHLRVLEQLGLAQLPGDSAKPHA
jgi:DNA-binding transcriptional ArsR family regulator